MKKTFKLLSLMLLSALLITGCSSGNASSGGSTLTVASDSEPVTFDIQATNDSATTRVARQIFEPLIKQNEDLELVPNLALSWEAVDDTTYEFKLKEGVTFHNGEAFTASDVEWTIRRAMESASIGHIVGALDGDKLKVIDDHTIQIGTTVPFGPLLTHLAHPATAMLNEKAVTEAGEDVGTMPVGTGPYKLDAWNAGSDLTLSRYEDYHGDAGKSDKIVFRLIAENSVRLIELETGGVDIAYAIAPADISKVEENDDLVMVRDLDLSTSYVGFNMLSDTPLKEKLVRQAINYAIDVESLLDAVYLGVGKPAVAPLNAQAFGANLDLPQYTYDVAKAKELLAEAGYADGFAVNLYVGDNNPQRLQIAQVLKEELKGLNIDVNVKQLEWGAYLDATANGEHDIYILGWTTVTTDGDYGLYPLFHSGQFGAAGNRSYYANDAVDKLLDDARTSSDQALREQYYKEAQVYINDEAPWLFLQDGENLTGISKNVKGFRHHPTATHFLSGVSVDE